jgi:hypothetical protein
VANDVSASCDPTAVVEALRAAQPGIDKRVDTTAHDTADRVAADAQRRVARRTGETAASIHVEPARKGTGYVVVAGGAARFLETGTKYMLARAFLYPAVRIEQAGFDRRIGNDVQDGIDAVGLEP